MAAIHQSRESPTRIPKIKANATAATVVSRDGIGWSSSSCVHRAAATRPVSAAGPRLSEDSSQMRSKFLLSSQSVTAPSKLCRSSRAEWR